MNWRWLIFDYADPELPLTFWQRMKVALRPIALWKLPPGTRMGRVLFALGFVLWFVARQFVRIFLPISISNLGWFIVYEVISLGTLWVWACFLLGIVGRREYLHRVRMEGFDVCPRCGYWLRGLDDGVDAGPECGEEREPASGTDGDRGDR